MKLLPKHRFITKAAKIDPQASDSPREAQGGGRGLACQAMPPRLSREVGPRIPGARCPATGTRQCPSLIKPPRASTPALCAPRGPSTKRALQGGGRVGCVRLSSPASLGSNLAASSFLMARGSGEGQCKARGLGCKLSAGVVLAETRNGGFTCSGSSSRPQPPPTGPPQAPTAARLPWTQRSRSRVQEEVVWWFPQARPWSGSPHPPAASEQQGFLLEVIPLPEGQTVELFHAHPKHFPELLGRQVSLQMKRETQSRAVSNLAKCPRKRGLQREWESPWCIWFPIFPLHPRRRDLQRGWGVSLGAPGSPASLCIPTRLLCSGQKLAQRKERWLGDPR